MKLKGVNPLEQHVEKIVLAGVSVVFLGVLTMQFLLEPNKVKVGTAPPVAPGKAFLIVESKARELQAVMTRQDLSNVLPPAPKYDLVNQLGKQRELPIIPARALALGPKLPFEGSDAPVGVAGNDRIAPLRIQAPAQVVAAAFRGTLDPTEPENIPGLKPFVPVEQPLDTKAVSVACVFDGTTLKAALAAAPEGKGVKAIPMSWWRDSMEIMSVKLERQEQKPNGNWSDATEVPPAPGRFNMTVRLRDVRATQDLMDAVAEARSEAEDIQRPAFYRQIAGTAWAPPVPGAAPIEVGVKNPDVDRLVSRIATANKSLDVVKKQRDDTAAAPVRAPAARNPGGGGDGGGGGKGSGGGQIAPPTQSGPSMTQQEKDSKLRALEKRIKDTETQIAKDVDALNAVGRDESGKALAAAPIGEAGNAPAAKPLMENPEVKLWSHDMTVQAGKTYRYRVKLGLNNPAFARTSALVPEQQELAGSALAYSQPSAWSEPVQVLPDQFYFLTSATEADQLGPPRATAEVFRFFYGYFRKASVSLEPGDMVAANIKLPDLNKLPIYDIKAGAVAPAPGTPPPAVQPPSPGKGGAGGKGGVGRQPEDERRGPVPVGGQGPVEAGKVTLPPNAKPYPKPTISVAVDAMLLDVAKAIAAGEGAARSQAYLRGPDGQIVVAVPEDQRRSAVYQMAAASAKEGENQGQPLAPSTEPGKDPNKKPEPASKTPTPRPSAPGGGGGGTGGG